MPTPAAPAPKITMRWRAKGVPVTREITSIQSQIAGPVSALPESDPRRARFDPAYGMFGHSAGRGWSILIAAFDVPGGSA